MTFGRAFWVGLLNTLLVASLGIVLAAPGLLAAQICQAVAGTAPVFVSLPD